MCFDSNSSSASSSSSSVDDERIGADGGSSIARVESSGAGAITIGSDKIASEAIKNSKEQLAVGTDFARTVFTQVLELTGKSLQSAENNISASRDFAAGIIEKEQESSDDRLIKLVTYIMLAGVGIVAIQSGVLKGVLK